MDRRPTNLENSSQEKQDAPNSSASCFCVLEIFEKLTIADQGKGIIINYLTLEITHYFLKYIRQKTTVLPTF